MCEVDVTKLDALQSELRRYKGATQRDYVSLDQLFSICKDVEIGLDPAKSYADGAGYGQELGNQVKEEYHRVYNPPPLRQGSVSDYDVAQLITVIERIKAKQGAAE